ncbi:DUF1707 SHOCT-like domain-containing protein [Luteococcus sp. Sow4_B9]|uniref:DUF1707 SHOCT-like domain-containing protein n=1 Tax=Luteococcus sp. Sow4_B9 TaxID=3438792 RepID=UPI003F9A080B
MDGSGGYRIGDQERDEAVAQLREHHALGRIDASEFDERMSSALAARTLADLALLFGDLPPLPGRRTFGDGPALEPVQPTAAPVATGNAWNWRQGLSGAAFPLAVIACFATGWRYWWIMLVPMMVTAALLGDDDDGDHDGDEDSSTHAKALGAGNQKALPKGSAE